MCGRTSAESLPLWNLSLHEVLSSPRSHTCLHAVCMDQGGLELPRCNGLAIDARARELNALVIPRERCPWLPSDTIYRRCIKV